jgi:hypothetical protein
MPRSSIVLLHACVRVILIWALLAPLALFAPHAAAQGTMGMLPGPITTQELDGYAKRLGLSPQQRRAVDGLHDQYKQEFRALREGDIATFLKRMEELEGNGGMPSRKAMEEFLKRMDELTRRIAGIDNRFLDQLQGGLTEQQLIMLPRVKQARQRARVAGNRMLWMTGQPPFDLSGIVLDLELTAPEHEVIDPILAQYEQRLTGDMTRLADETTHLITDMFEALEKMGFTEESMEDPEQQAKMFEAMQTLMQDLAAKGMEIATDLIDLNQRTYRSMAAALQPQNARKLRYKFYQRAYPEAAFALETGDVFFDKALAHEGLTDAQRDSVRATRDELCRKLDAISDEVIAEIVAWRKQSTPFNYDEQAANAYNKKLQESAAKAEEARVAAQESFKSALGDLADKFGDLRAASAEESQEQTLDPAIAAAEAAQPNEAEEYPDDHGWGADQFLPPAISERDLSEYAERLGLNDDQRLMLGELHQRYTEQWQKDIDPQTAALQTTVGSLWRWDEAMQTSSGPTVEQINGVYNTRTSILDAIRKVDEAFFDEVQLALVTDESNAPSMQRVRLTRERAMYSRGSWSWSPSGEASVDLSRVVLRVRRSLSAEALAAADAEVGKWEQAALPILRDRHSRSMEAQKVQEVWSAEMNRANQAGGEEGGEGNSNAIAMSMKYQEMMRDPQKALTDANVALADLNRTTLQTILAALPAETANRVRRDYNKRAFPNVYSDAAVLDQHLERARRLPDLTDDQSRRLADLAAEYHPAYTALCEQMVEASAGMERDNWMAMTDSEDMDAWRKRQETLAKLTFDRNELNARGAGTLRAVLTEDQIKRIGGLPKIEDENEFGW